MVLKNYT